MAPGEHVAFADFRKDTFANWFVSGEAFGASPSGGLVLQADPKQPIKSVILHGIAHSGLVSSKLAGVMRSQNFIIEKKKIHFRTMGRKGQIRLIIDDFQIIRDPIYGGLAFPVDNEALQWRTMDVSMWLGHRAYIEIVDDGPGFIGVEQIVFSDLALPKAPKTAGQAAAGQPRRRSTTPMLPPGEVAQRTSSHRSFSAGANAGDGHGRGQPRR